MNRRYLNLVVVILLLVVTIYLDTTNKIAIINRDIPTVLGLDLRGGTEVLLEVPAGVTIPSANALSDARTILEQRSSGLIGTTEVSWQVAGERRIVGEIPGVTDPQSIIDIIKQTGLLEFVDMAAVPQGSPELKEGTPVLTDYAKTGTGTTPTSVPSAVPTAAPTVAATATTPEATSQPSASPTATAAPIVYHTIMTGSALTNVGVSKSTTNQYEVTFQLSDTGKQIFGDWTTKNVGKILAIVLDGKIISAPVVNTPITQGSGSISGSFTVDSANALAVQLRYGSLPIPLDVIESRVIGPTLGQDSLNKSLLAGIIGFTIVALFMLIFYRLPGVIAILSILTYALITFSLFKIIPVTLTLPGIAGFLLSTGGALDANILIFERLKEELRNGRTLSQAIDLGWRRAWPSIRDSNIATLLTSIILFWFGSSFGATIVKGFAVTLFLGVVVSLFCAWFVTRTFMHVGMDFIKDPTKHVRWFGI